MNLFKKIFFVSVLLFASNCKKSKNTTNIPLVSVNVVIYLNNPSYVDLNAVGGWVYVPGGVKGLLIYRLSTSDFKVYERNCTYQPTNECALIKVDNTNIIAVDTCCSSKFSLVDGSVIKEPAGLPLKTYNSLYDGNTLHIFN